MEQVKFGCGMSNFRAVGQKVEWVNLESGTSDSLSLVNIILTPAEIQMNNWKPDVTNIMQLFQDFDNKEFNVDQLLPIMKLDQWLTALPSRYLCLTVISINNLALFKLIIARQLTIMF